MRLSVHMRSISRQPVRTLILLLLISAISFAFVFRGVEYIIIQTEIERLSEYYRPIGKLYTDAPEFVLGTTIITEDGTIIADYPDLFSRTESDYDISPALNLVRSSKYFYRDDIHRFGFGALNDIYNADIDGSSSNVDTAWYDEIFKDFPDGWNSDMDLHINEVYFYGEIISKGYNEHAGNDGVCYLEIKVEKIEAGYRDYFSEGETVSFLIVLDDGGLTDSPYFDLAVGERYFLSTYYLTDFVLTRVDINDKLVLKPLIDEEWYVEAHDGWVDFTQPELAELKNEVETLDANTRTLSVHSTNDMSAMPEAQQSMRRYYLTEGRWINDEDNLNESLVCVVHDRFAGLRGLAIGDKLKITLRPLADVVKGIPYIISDTDKAAWQTYPTLTLEYEIVGTYSDRQFGSVSLDYITMFVPNSTLPLEFTTQSDYVSYRYYNFMLKSALDKELFIAENEAALEELGIRVEFIENNADSFLASVIPIRQTALANAVVFGVLMILVIMLTVFIYLRLRRRDFVISRALGVPKRASRLQVLFPFVLIGAAGILSGGLPAWFYATREAEQNLAEVTNLQIKEAALISPIWFIGICLCILIVLCLITVFSIQISLKSSALSLLQGGSNTRTKAVPVVNFTEAENKKVYTSNIQFKPQPVLNKRWKFFLANSLRWIGRRVRRVPIKSLLTCLVAAFYVFALTMFEHSIEQNKIEIDRLYDTTQVEGEVMAQNQSFLTGKQEGIIKGATVESLIGSNLVLASYLEMLVPRNFIASLGTPMEFKQTGNMWSEDLQASKVSILATNNWERFFETSAQGIFIVYAKGYDENILSDEFSLDDIETGNIPLILPESYLPQLGVGLGEKIYISDGKTDRVNEGIIAGVYVGELTSDSFSYPVLAPTSLVGAYEKFYKRLPNYCKVELTFDPLMNREFSEQRDRLTQIVKREGAGIIELRLILWDEELKSVIEPLEDNLRLMEILYPLAAAILILIGVILVTLLMLQNTKEAAIMRVLGNTRRWTCTLFTVEYTALCAVGLCIGAIASRVITEGISVSILINMGAYFVLSIITTIITSGVITRKSPLSLLQVNE